jgi:hypothetical protein
VCRPSTAARFALVVHFPVDLDTDGAILLAQQGGAEGAANHGLTKPLAPKARIVTMAFIESFAP